MRIEKIFSLEHGISGTDKIKKIRNNQGKEAVKEFFKYCEATETLPKSLTGKAISYAINQKDNLMRYLENEKLEMTNNRAERAIKPFVIGRKNWLFENIHILPTKELLPWSTKIPDNIRKTN